ncbi:hypothetical protein BDV32DRAFT_120140, partial [Aspergillus pseudonomiae]
METMRLLLENGADVRLQASARFGPESHLLTTCERGYREAAKLLIENSACFSHDMDLLHTALQDMSGNEYKEAVRLLLGDEAAARCDL